MLRAVATLFFLASLWSSAAAQKCQRHDVPRRSFQWPRFKSGKLPKSKNKAPLLVDNAVTLEDASKSEVVKTAFDHMLAEVTSIDTTGCTPDENRTKLKSITVTITDAAAILQYGFDESYTLELKGDKVTITAPTQFGARHAVVSLHNLLQIESCKPEMAKTGKFLNMDYAGGLLVLPFDDFKVVDAPRLGHRGLMLDTARAFVPLDMILDILRVMGRAKLNVFHWHATDDQSFPLVMPKTAQTIHGAGGKDCMTKNDQPCLGAYTNEKTYSENDIKKVIDTAENNGVRVIIEVDMPSHARSWGSASAEYLECYGASEQIVNICLEPVCGPLALKGKFDKVLQLAKDIFDDLDALTRPGEVIHLGMDEVQAGCWGEENRDKLMMKWLQEMTEYAESKKRRITVWQDVLFDHPNAVVPETVKANNVIGQVWNNPALGVELIENGTEIIWSDYTKMYLDCGRGNPAAANYHSWCNPYKTWWDVYTSTPDVITNDIEAKKRIRGGEVCMWAEQANEFNLHPLLWPRVTAWAGAAWEDRDGEPQYWVGDTNDINAHLRDFSWTMMRDCIGFTPMQTMWCSYGDAIEDPFLGRADVGYCDLYAAQYYVKPSEESTTTEAETTPTIIETAPTTPPQCDCSTNGVASLGVSFGVVLVVIMASLRY